MLSHVLNRYLELEHGVQELIREQCGASCALCTAFCCRADLCEEALESPFLCALHGRTELDSDAYGFRTESGCALTAGRPPVCYEFFCDDLLADQPDEAHRDALRKLGRLPGHAGERACEGAALAELRQASQLHRLEFHRLGQQLDEAQEALETLREFFQQKTLPERADRVLARIVPGGE